MIKITLHHTVIRRFPNDLQNGLCFVLMLFSQTINMDTNN